MDDLITACAKSAISSDRLIYQVAVTQELLDELMEKRGIDENPGGWAHEQKQRVRDLKPLLGTQLYWGVIAIAIGVSLLLGVARLLLG